MTPQDPRQTRPGIGADMTAEQAVLAVLSSCLANFDDHRAALMTDDAPEGPHGARVALRRFRTALDGFHPLLRKTRVKPLKDEAKAIFSLLGTLRDADVLSGQLVPDGEAKRLSAEADRIRVKVREELTAREADGFAAGARLILDRGDWQKRDKNAKAARKAPVKALAADALDRAWMALGGHGKHVRKMPVAERHRFRKDLKALRYLTDFFSELWPGKREVRFAARLKRLQDALGLLNDLAVAEDRLGERGSNVRAVLRDEAMAAAQNEWRALRKAGPWWG